MKIESSTYHQLLAPNWTCENSLIEINPPPCPASNSDYKDIIEVQNYEVIPSRSLTQIEKESTQRLRFLYRGMTFQERMALNRDANIYQNQASILDTDYKNQIDVRV